MKSGVRAATGTGTGRRWQEACPIWVGELDLASPPQRLVAPQPPPPVDHYHRGRLLVRLLGEPLGLLPITLLRGEADLAEVLAAACSTFEPELAHRLGSDWRRELVDASQTRSCELTELLQDPLPSISVVIGTRNRPEHIVAAVSCVLKQSYPSPVEIIVVDNAPSTLATRHAIADHFGSDDRVLYLHESKQGLSRARNIGLAAATHAIVAFLSDDIQVDPLWLVALARGFARGDDVRCVLGYCPPLYLDTAEQLVFEKTMGWGWRSGFEPRLLSSVDETDRLHPYRFGMGIGANMSFSTDWLRQIGGFDEMLGPGTLARGGEDLGGPVRTLLDGGQVAYEPAAVGWHADRYDDRDFTGLMYTYGLGLTAFLASHVVSPRTRWEVLRRVPSGLRHIFRPAILPAADELFDDVEVRRSHRLANFAGRLAGPLAYARSRAANRNIDGNTRLSGSN